ncbi:MAG: hypothetical protein AB1609_08875 [Bacillota bacterium]
MDNETGRPKEDKERDRLMKAAALTQSRKKWTAEELARLDEGLRKVAEWTRSKGITEEELAALAREAIDRIREERQGRR